MGISIRDPRVDELARELAKLRNTNMTEAIGHALHAEIARERAKPSLEERLEALARETMAMAKPGGRDVSKEEIDALWGQ